MKKRREGSRGHESARQHDYHFGRTSGEVLLEVNLYIESYNQWIVWPPTPCYV
jgi:hypothetical protein